MKHKHAPKTRPGTFSRFARAITRKSPINRAWFVLLTMGGIAGIAAALLLPEIGVNARDLYIAGFFFFFGYTMHAYEDEQWMFTFCFIVAIFWPITWLLGVFMSALKESK